MTESTKSPAEVLETDEWSELARLAEAAKAAGDPFYSFEGMVEWGEFQAAANPATVLRLITALRQASIREVAPAEAGEPDVLVTMRDHYTFALKGPWPGIATPNYALAGLFKMAGDEIESLRAQPQARESLPPISLDGPNLPDEHRVWLARQLLDSKLTDDEAYGIVSHSPAVKPQACEDAQPVAWRMIGRDGSTISLQAEPYHGGFAQMMSEDVGCTVQSLYTHPDPDALRVAAKALEKASRAISAQYALAQAEYQHLDTVASKHDKIVQEGRRAIREALAALQAEQKGGA